jgi:hypothetical protein
MLFQKKPETETVTLSTVKRELDALITDAEVAHVNRHVLIDLLESRVAALRMKAAVSYSSAPSFVSGNLPS